MLFCFFFNLNYVFAYQYINLTQTNNFNFGGTDYCDTFTASSPSQALDDSFSITIPSSHKTLKFSNLIQKLQPLIVNETTGDLIATEYTTVRDFRGVEGLYQSGGQCLLCPYYSKARTSECDNQEFRVCYEPLDGFCLDAQLSDKLQCYQNQLFWPSSWFGEFYYPPQRPSILDGIPDILGYEFEGLHHFFSSDMDKNPNERIYFPSIEYNSEYFKYGMTRRNIIFQRNSWASAPNENIHNYDAQEDIIKEFRDQYSIERHTWGLWLQSLCDQFCHRDSLFLVRNILMDQIVNRTEYWYLSILQKQNKPQEVCFQCPRHTDMVYMINQPPYVPHIHWLMQASKDCRPWFGAVPRLDDSKTNFAQIFSDYKIANDGSFPTEGGYLDTADTITRFESSECGINTYNRICDLTKAYQSRSSHVPGSTFLQPQCTPCPPGGYHTDGLTGSWYCLPPLGRILKHRNLFRSYLLPNNISKVWARRDVIKYEFECGISPSECQQCNSSGKGTSGFTPDQFNEKVIFEPLLVDEICPEHFYCPHAFKVDPISCPSGLCSPPGSHSISNCSCCPRQYLNATSGLCIDCLPPLTSCGSGEYLQGAVECASTIGPKNVQICVNCTNIPTGTAYVLSSGIEVGTVATSISNFCPFQCKLGYVVRHPSQQDNQIPCFRSFVCQPITSNLNPYQLSSGSFAYIETSVNSIPFDGVRLKTGTCVIDTNFTSFFDAWKSQASLSANVDTTCSCGGVCKVVQNATLFHNFNCSRCDPLNPDNSKYSSQAILGLTSKPNEHCIWTCNTGFYRENQTCVNCTQKSLEICSTGWVLRGNGCAGDFTSIETFNTSHCFNCSQNLVGIRSYQYLDLAECLVKNCTPVSLVSGNYFIKRCGGGTNSANEQALCTQCLSTQYESRACGVNETLDRQCLSCTQYKQGYYLVSNCTAFADSVWYSCPINSYCPGDGYRIKCPVNTESIAQSSSLLNCHCKFGLEKNINTGLCETKVCPDTLPNLDVPSITENLQSPYYLSWDASSASTICVPCSQTTANVLAQGSMMNVQSCRCLSSNTYIPSFQSNITCSDCQTQTNDDSCTPTNFYMRPSFCMPIGAKRTCYCILPPFSKALSNSCPLPQTLTCADNFVPTTSTQSLPDSFTKNITGSNIYVPQSNNVWMKAFHVDEQVIGIMRSTFNDNISHYSASNQQYVLWTVPSLSVKRIFVQRVVVSNSVYTMHECLASSRCSPYETEEIRNWWQVICEATQSLQIVSFSVYPWLRAMSPDLFFGNSVIVVGSTHVVALLYDSSKYYASFIEMSAKSNAEVEFEYQLGAAGCGGSSPNILLNIPSDSTIINTVAKYQSPGNAMIDQSVYVGYNFKETSLILGLFKNSTSQIQYELNFTLAGRQLMGFCAYSTDSGIINILAIFNDDVASVKSYRWREFRSLQVQDMEIELFLPTSFTSTSKVYSFQVMFSRDYFVANYVLVIDTPKGVRDSSQIYTADQYQKTFTLIQDMHPETSPKHVAIYETSFNQAVMWASGLHAIYSIRVSKCRLTSRDSPPNYWDGSVCRPHHCIRRPPCASQANKEYNVNLNQCVCKPGYYEVSGSCELCRANSYCMNGNMIQCTPTFLTSLPGSMYVQNCSCPWDGYYYTSSGCVSCPRGSYCPDRWNRHLCPGNFLQDTTADVGSMYPIGCTCAQGSEGAGCSACPSGYVCPVSQPPKIVQNIAVRLEIREKQANVQSALIQSMVCETILPMIQSYFVQYSPNAFVYMKDLDTLRPRYFCIYHRSQDLLRHESYFIIMIQVDETYMSDIIKNLFQFYQNIPDLNLVQTSGGVENYVTYLHTIPRPTSQNQFPPASSKLSNVKIQCSTGEIPDATRIKCICRRGYENQLTTCSPCRIGTFKAEEGTGYCQQCPFQTTTTGLASSACISSSNSNGTKQGGSSSSSALTGDNLYIIVGGAVGGVVVAVVFVFVYYYCFAL